MVVVSWKAAVASTVCIGTVLCVSIAGFSSCVVQGRWATEHACEGDSGHPWEVPVWESPRTERHIVVCVIADENVPGGLRNSTLENKAAYATARGYSFRAPGPKEARALADNFPTPWGKFPMALALFDEGFEYVAMMDADAVVMRSDVSLDAAAEALEKEGKSLLISEDFNGLNSGVFLLRNDAWGRAFLEAAWETRHVLGRVHAQMPLFYENRAFLYLTNTWPHCGWGPRPDTLMVPRVHTGAATWRAGIFVVDHCILNTRPPTNPAWYETMRSGVSYDSEEGAFIVHAAGGAHKAETLARLLQTTGV